MLLWAPLFSTSSIEVGFCAKSSDFLWCCWSLEWGSFVSSFVRLSFGIPYLSGKGYGMDVFFASSTVPMEASPEGAWVFIDHFANRGLWGSSGFTLENYDIFLYRSFVWVVVDGMWKGVEG